MSWIPFRNRKEAELVAKACNGRVVERTDRCQKWSIEFDDSPTTLDGINDDDFDRAFSLQKGAIKNARRILDRIWEICPVCNFESWRSYDCPRCNGKGEIIRQSWLIQVIDNNQINRTQKDAPVI